jgi:tetratricopeptide (TPR) repeat protein
MSEHNVSGQSSGVWNMLRSLSPLYVSGFLIMAAFAAWDAHTPVTMIAPFQVPKVDLPFSGDIVADALQDALKAIHNEIERETQDPGLRLSETGLPDLRNVLIPQFRQIQAPARFTVEVKGLSYERILSVARASMGTEATVSGDVLVNGKEFVLIARTADAGPWVSVSSPISAEGLTRASRDLAEKIVATQDPIVAGVALLKKGKVDEGLAALNRARSLKPTDARLKMNLCMGFGANRRYDQAIECYKDVLRMNPSSPQEVAERLAQVLYLHGDRDAAIKWYEELYKQGYKHALLGLGEALDDTDRPADALNRYNEFLTTESLDRDVAIAHVKKGAALAHLGRHDEALAEYQEALNYSPRDVLILVHKGLELAKAGDAAAGIAQLQSVVDENKDADSTPFASLQLGLLLQQKGEWQRAVDQFRMASEQRPNYVEAHLRLADALVHESHRVEALGEYNSALRLSASDVERGYSQTLANQWLGNALRDVRDYSGAASAYRKAIRLSPDFGPAHCQLGALLAKQGDLRQAIYHYGAAIVPARVKELNDTKCVVMAQHQLEEVLAGKGKLSAEHIVELHEPPELERRLRESYFLVGKALNDEGNFVEAASQCKEAIKLNPQSAAAHNLLGLALDKQGLVEQAVVEYRTAVNLEPRNAAYIADLARGLAIEHSIKKVPNESATIAKLN